MPRTNLHLNPFNELHQRLSPRRSPVERAGAWFWYVRQSPYVAIIHDTKYHSLPSIGREAGRLFATEVMADGFFTGVDMLLPVPMHPAKERRRGFNQADVIAEGIARVTGLPIVHNLKAVHSHDTQTRKSALERAANLSGAFRLDCPEEIDGRHIMLIDDVITTGATMQEALDTVHRAAPQATISVAALAATRLVG